MLSRLATVASRGARAGLMSRPTLQGLASLPRMISTSEESRANSEVPQNLPSKGVLDYYKEKAGLSAPTVFGIGLTTFLLSKEIFVINEEALLLVMVAGTITYLVKKVGKSVGDALDAESNSVLESLNESKNAKIDALKKAIAQEEEVEKIFECRGEVFDILKDNNAMQMEIEYRNRLHEVHEEVKKRLDYQVDLQNLENRLETQHIIDWVERSVIGSISPKQEADAMEQCIKDLNAITLK